jgi:hypothetical protein
MIGAHQDQEIANKQLDQLQLKLPRILYNRLWRFPRRYLRCCGQQGPVLGLRVSPAAPVTNDAMVPIGLAAIMFDRALVAVGCGNTVSISLRLGASCSACSLHGTHVGQIIHRVGKRVDKTDRVVGILFAREVPTLS